VVDGRSSASAGLPAQDVAQVVAFLASSKSIAISGDVIVAGGGRPGAIYY
jgi:enoyl-[acyl-carrier-protein] reductase (NADH)